MLVCCTKCPPKPVFREPSWPRHPAHKFCGAPATHTAGQWAALQASTGSCLLGPLLKLLTPTRAVCCRATPLCLRGWHQSDHGCCSVLSTSGCGCAQFGPSSLRPPHAVFLSCRVCTAYDLNLLAGQRAWNGRLYASGPLASDSRCLCSFEHVLFGST